MHGPDYHAVPVPTPDPHGAAALSLIESLIHFLVDRAGMAHADAVGVIQIAADAKSEISRDHGDGMVVEPQAVSLLNAIAASLAIDAP